MKNKPEFETQIEYMEWRLDRRVKAIHDRVEKNKRGYLERCKKLGEAPGEADRLWLDGFAVGNGLDIACGDFLIGDAQGVDGTEKMIGTDYWSEGDELVFHQPESLDFVVTNYLDGFANPLKALNEWWRCLASGGVLALTCRDAEMYSTSGKGPLENARRASAFTSVTLAHYMYRAGFEDVTCDRHKAEKTLRCSGFKP